MAGGRRGPGRRLRTGIRGICGIRAGRSVDVAFRNSGEKPARILPRFDVAHSRDAALGSSVRPSASRTRQRSALTAANVSFTMREKSRGSGTAAIQVP
ncbi:hypothetical protein FRACA_1870007 [Frankia canadensis]|uniref:Uncharacterized protein n=1 Tax=Frankia canadensis TaxID=1836972 RepID=A0A2I2KNZ5_9ACTN|nr:hypothetical protein FRACA_1870007 [Frankia canadensis]SOU54681.1 hypothetical protein FRACA_1870007 [Frankia canadensis]